MTAADKLSRNVRELACLALGHLDAERTSCSAPVDDLVADLVVEVHRLRVIVGDEPVDRVEGERAVGDALDVAAGLWATDTARQALVVLDQLGAAGWAVVRVARR